MSGVDAAATLSLKIDTTSANESLTALENRMKGLGASLNSGSAAQPKAISSIGTSAAEASAQLKTLQATVGALEAKISSMSTGGKTGIFGNVTKAGYEIQGLFGKVDHSVERTDSNLKTMLKSAEMAGSAAVKQANDLARAKNLANSLELRVIAAEEAAKIKKAADDVAALGRAKNLANSLELRVIAAEEAAKAKKAADDVAALGRAKNLANSLELRVVAAEDAARLKAAAKDAQELAKWLSLTDKQRASATVQAAKAVYGGAQQSVLPGVAGSSQALAAAQSAGSVGAAEAELARLTNTHKALTPAIKQSADHQLHWNKITNEGHAAVRGLSGSLGTLWITYGSLVPLLAGAAIGSAFVNAAKAGSEFSYQLTFVKALGNESAEAIERLSSSALALSQTGLRGPTEIASGYRILAQAGLDAAAALEVMPHVLNLSTVGEMEMEQAATTLVGVMTAFNLKVEDAGHVGDVFAKAAALSQTSVQSMTEAMKYASVVGEQYGASLEDSAAALTLLAKVNITGTSAGTAYRNMLKELFTPVPQAAKAMNKLGLETRDANGNLKSFVDIMNDLREKMKDFSQGDTLSITQRIFGERGGKEASRMLAIEKADWDKLVASIKDSNGFMEGVATQLENTAKGKWAQALNTLKVQLVTAFQEMEPAFSDLADNFKQLFSDPSFVSGLKSIVGGVASLTSTLVSMASVLLTGVQIWAVYKAAVIGAAVWTSAATAASGFAASMLAVNGVMGPALGTMATLRGVIGGLPSLLLAIPTPLTIIAGALAAGATAWAIWGGAASRAGDMAYDSAKRAEGALAKVRRREKYGVGDLGEAQEELDKAEKLLNLRIEGRATGTALSDARASVGKWTEVVTDLEKEKYKASNASEGLKKAVEGKPATRKASEILGPDPKPVGGGPKKVRDYSGDLEKSNIASLVEQQQENIKVLDLVHKNHLITEEQYQSNIAGIYAEWGPKIESEYRESISRLAKLQATSSGDEAKQYEKKRKDMETAYRKFQFDEAYRSADSLAAEQGRIKKSGEEIQKIMEEQQANTDQIMERLAATRLKLDMTPEQAAGYDARKAVEKPLDKAIAGKQAEAQNLLNAGYTEETTNMKAVRAEIELLLEARSRLAGQAAAQAEAEVGFARSYEFGWKQAFRTWTDEGTNAAKTAADSFAIMTSSMESLLDNFLTTGKLNFADFAKSVILSIAKIEAKAALAKGLKAVGGDGGGFGGIISGILGAITGGGGGGFSSGDFANLASSFIDSAKGNVFSGSPSLHTYANTVQTSPKTFAFRNLHGFARGGVFAEAGPEAVMPLSRDSKGRLGVHMQGKSGGQPINITVHVNGNSNAPDVRRAAGQGAREALSLMNGARRYG